jgi:hypothetical protein
MDDEREERLADRHLRAGYLALALYISIGALLEVFHAIKSPIFVDAGRETTRLLLRLGHAHGTLLSLVNIVYALTLRARPAIASSSISSCLLAALVLLPLGFLLGGVWAQAGDPGLGIVLVPAGAFLLIAAVIGVAIRLRAAAATRQS